MVQADDPQKSFTTVAAGLGRECLEWGKGRTNTAIKALIEENMRPGDVVIFTDGSMKKFLIESNNCHEIAYKHFYTSRICILNVISLPTQSTYFPHKNPEMAINISIYI